VSPTAAKDVTVYFSDACIRDEDVNGAKIFQSYREGPKVFRLKLVALGEIEDACELLGVLGRR
jgi:hypothetical protein